MEFGSFPKNLAYNVKSLSGFSKKPLSSHLAITILTYQQVYTKAAYHFHIFANITELTSFRLRISKLTDVINLVLMVNHLPLISFGSRHLMPTQPIVLSLLYTQNVPVCWS